MSQLLYVDALAHLVVFFRVCFMLYFVYNICKRQDTDTGCGLSSSGMSELALFQELHSYSIVAEGHTTLLVPLAVVMGTGNSIPKTKLNLIDVDECIGWVELPVCVACHART